ncbi:putative transcriptional regulator, LysR family protein [Zafaria cholistanensis]|uniref:Putative transcriptional regulator, LysR family protein n=1 Tax=Zafaria cholistanensis TaxID=1682741 RepID=A0A5A7NMP3_9MICC|nr:putative transcriptional regulator, LysR family protein [Zafaria cholistanensis]
MARLAPQLRALEALAAQGGHMTRAAEALGIPQSSMSRRIQALEDHLGVPLLVHVGRTVELTPLALSLSRQLRGPLHELRHALDAAASTADPEGGTVRFGIPLTMGTGVLPDIIAGFHRQNPLVSLHLKQAHGQQLARDVAAGSLDLAVLIPPPAGVEHTVIGRQEIRAVLPPSHRLASRKALRVSELRGEAFIANPPEYTLRALVDSMCLKAGFEPSVAIEVTEFSLIRRLVQIGLGIALLPAGEVPQPGLAEIPLLPPAFREVALAWGPTARTPPAQRLLAFVRAAFRDAA